MPVRTVSIHPYRDLQSTSSIHVLQEHDDGQACGLMRGIVFHIETASNNLNSLVLHFPRIRESAPRSSGKRDHLSCKATCLGNFPPTLLFFLRAGVQASAASSLETRPIALISSGSLAVCVSFASVRGAERIVHVIALVVNIQLQETQRPPVLPWDLMPQL